MSSLSAQELKYETWKAKTHLEKLLQSGYQRVAGPVASDHGGTLTITLWARDDVFDTDGNVIRPSGVVCEVRTELGDGTEQITFCYTGSMKHGPDKPPEPMSYQCRRGDLP